MVVQEDDVMQACPNDTFPLHEDVFQPFCKRRKAGKEEKEMARICEIFSSKDHSLEHESFMAEFGMCPGFIEKRLLHETIDSQSSRLFVYMSGHGVSTTLGDNQLNSKLISETSEWS